MNGAGEPSGFWLPRSGGPGGGGLLAEGKVCRPPLQHFMGHGAMAVLSLQEAAERTETSKVDIWRAIQAGRLLAQRTDDGGFAIDPAELFRVFEPQRPDERPMGQDATAAPEASKRPETSATPETAATNDMAVAFAALGAELKGLLELPAEAPANDELCQNQATRPSSPPASGSPRRANGSTIAPAVSNSRRDSQNLGSSVQSTSQEVPTTGPLCH